MTCGGLWRSVGLWGLRSIMERRTGDVLFPENVQSNTVCVSGYSVNLKIFYLVGFCEITSCCICVLSDFIYLQWLKELFDVGVCGII